MNPTASSIKGLIKLYKPDQPIRPVINWRNAPAYKLSRLFVDKVNHIPPLPHAFKLKNTQDLLKNINETPMKPHYTLASLDITNMYSNIPVKEAKKMLSKILTQRSITPKTKKSY
jgi:hypothetical protein